MKIVLGKKELVVSLSSVCAECGLSPADSLAAFNAGQHRLERVNSMRASSRDRLERETAALLNGAARLRTP